MYLLSKDKPVSQQSKESTKPILSKKIMAVGPENYERVKEEAIMDSGAFDSFVRLFHLFRRRQIWELVYPCWARRRSKAFVKSTSDFNLDQEEFQCNNL